MRVRMLVRVHMHMCICTCTCAHTHTCACRDDNVKDTTMHLTHRLRCSTTTTVERCLRGETWRDDVERDLGETWSRLRSQESGPAH